MGLHLWAHLWKLRVMPRWPLGHPVLFACSRHQGVAAHQGALRPGHLQRALVALPRRAPRRPAAHHSVRLLHRPSERTYCTCAKQEFLPLLILKKMYFRRSDIGSCRTMTACSWANPIWASWTVWASNNSANSTIWPRPRRPLCPRTTTLLPRLAPATKTSLPSAYQSIVRFYRFLLTVSADGPK